MIFAQALARLFRRKPAPPQAPDAFELRLQRIGRREEQRAVKPILFKALPQLLEA